VTAPPARPPTVLGSAVLAGGAFLLVQLVALTALVGVALAGAVDRGRPTIVALSVVVEVAAGAIAGVVLESRLRPLQWRGALQRWLLGAAAVEVVQLTLTAAGGSRSGLALVLLGLLVPPLGVGFGVRLVARGPAGVGARMRLGSGRFARAGGARQG